MSKNMIGWAVAVAAAAAFVGCATAPSDREVSAKATQVLKASFKPRGQAKLDRLDQDETQKLCTQYSGKVPPKDVVCLADRRDQLFLYVVQHTGAPTEKG